MYKLIELFNQSNFRQPFLLYRFIKNSLYDLF